MINKVIIVGRLGKDPDLRTTSSGTSVCNLNVATTDSWTDKNGSKNESTEWHRVVCFGKRAEVVTKFLNKGSLVYIEGKLQTRSWEDDQGQKRYSTEIIAFTVQFLETKKQENSAPQQHEFDAVPNFAPDEELPF